MKLTDSLKTVRINTPIETPKITTHIGYAKWFSNESTNLYFSSGLLSNPKSLPNVIKEKVVLIDLTLKSLSDEDSQVQEKPVFSRAASTWVTVKAYYCQFNLELILIYLISGNVEALRMRHVDVRKKMRHLLKSGQLSSSSGFVNVVSPRSTFKNSGALSGMNLKGSIENKIRYQQLMKILRKYAREDYKFSKNLKGLYGKHGQNFDSIEINLLDYFYWYRIKSNYRDMDFVADPNVSILDLKIFYDNFLSAFRNITVAYIDLINGINYKSKKRDDFITISPDNLRWLRREA